MSRISLMIAYLVACFVLSVSTPATAQVTTVEIWVRSFIPNRHDTNPGYIRPVPNRPGQTMMSGPTPVNDCFLTDNRWFSSDPSASARIGARLVINTGATPTIVSASHPPSVSVEVDCEDGDEECRKPVDTSRSRVGPIARQGSTVRIKVHGEANNACFAASPDIHYDGEFIVDVAAGSIKFEGTIGQFPAFEAYARSGSGPVRTIFQLSPASGSTALSVPLSRTINTEPVRF
jgi:hypothetical protein